MYLVLKTLITALLVVGISEAGKRFSMIGGILASLPLTSLLAFIWLYNDTKDIKAVSDLSYTIFWMVIPSLFFFLCLPFLLKIGWRFYPALITSSALMAAVYFVYVQGVKYFGIKL
jgi:uncharacterized membrane protein (GlpM family)